MVTLDNLGAILAGCVLVFSELEKKLSEVVGLIDPTTQKPVRGLQCTTDRIKWALWKEAEVGMLLQSLETCDIMLFMHV